MTDDAPRAEWLLTLLTWTSPSFPVGGFAFSHGLEWAVEAGDVTGADALCNYIAAALEDGGGWCDLVFLAAAWRAAQGNDAATLGDITDLAAAWRATNETALESRQQGAAFARALRAAWPDTPLAALGDARGDDIAYPVAVGAAAARLPLDAALLAYAQGFAANLVSAGVRLVPLGQSDGLRVLARLAPVITRVAAAAQQTTLDSLSSCAFRIDIASMRHENQYTRLFRS